MKTAVALFGFYNELYKKNEYQGDIFMMSHEPCDHSDAVFATNLKASPAGCIKDFDQVSLPAEYGTLVEYFIKKCDEMIDSYEAITGEKYERRVYAPFNAIVEVPDLAGRYTINLYSYTRINLPNVRRIDGFQVISDDYIRINGGETQCLHTLDLKTRNYIFSRLYKGKVCDFNSFSRPEDHTKVSFLVPSVIHTSENPFDYISRRSVFSHRERFEQTLKQVVSLSKVESSSTFILEGSLLNFHELNELSKYSTVIMMPSDQKANYYANVHKNKSIYEIYLLKTMLPKTNSDWVFKFGGRYRLRQSFNIHEYLRDKPVFKVVGANQTYSKTPIIECVIYAIPKNYHQKFLEYYGRIHELLEHSSGSTEDLLYKYCEGDSYNVKSLEVIGRDAVQAFEKSI